MVIQPGEQPGSMQVYIMKHGFVQFIFNPQFFIGQNMNEAEAEIWIKDMFDVHLVNKEMDHRIFIHIDTLSKADFSILYTSVKDYVPEDKWWDPFPELPGKI